MQPSSISRSQWPTRVSCALILSSIHCLTHVRTMMVENNIHVKVHNNVRINDYDNYDISHNNVCTNSTNVIISGHACTQ